MEYNQSLDVWGDKNSNGEYEVYCIASNGPSVPQGLALLRIKNNIVENLPITGLPLNLNSIWCINDKKYFVSGTKLFYSSKPEAGWQEEIYIYPFYKTSIRGSGFNNIFVVGAFGLISHFDGLTWSNQTISDARYRSVDIKNSTFTAVGRESGTNKAVILLGQQ